MRAKLRAVKNELKRRRHLPIPEQGRWLERVVQGPSRYYAVPGNIKAVRLFRHPLRRRWHKALRRRSQRTSLDWERMDRLADRWLQPARILHPRPGVRFDAKPKRGVERNECRSTARSRLR